MGDGEDIQEESYDDEADAAKYSSFYGDGANDEGQSEEGDED